MPHCLFSPCCLHGEVPAVRALGTQLPASHSHDFSPLLSAPAPSPLPCHSNSRTGLSVLLHSACPHNPQPHPRGSEVVLLTFSGQLRNAGGCSPRARPPPQIESQGTGYLSVAKGWQSQIQGPDLDLYPPPCPPLVSPCIVPWPVPGPGK